MRKVVTMITSISERAMSVLLVDLTELIRKGVFRISMRNGMNVVKPLSMFSDGNINLGVKHDEAEQG